MDVAAIRIPGFQTEALKLANNVIHCFLLSRRGGCPAFKFVGRQHSDVVEEALGADAGFLRRRRRKRIEREREEDETGGSDEFCRGAK